jgi:hypothetical protein
MKTANQFMQTIPIKVPGVHQFTIPIHQVPQRPPNDALQIKAAEYWLKLGEADQALKELENLPSKVWTSGLALKTRIAALGALRERAELNVQA